jgi:hypothetical protein
VFSLDPDVPPPSLERQLTAKDLVPPIDRELVAVARRGDRAPFAHLLAEVGLTPDQVVFVSLDAGQRKDALGEGLRVAPHLALAESVLAGHSLRYSRLSAPASAEAPNWASLLANVPAVPVFRTDAGRSLYVIASSAAFTLLSTASIGTTLTIDLLGAENAPSDSTLFLLQVTPQQAAADDELNHFLTSLEQRDLPPEERDFPFVQPTPDGWLVALPGNRSLDDLHPPPAGAGHGHTRILLPDTSLLKGRERQDFQRTLRRFGRPD